MCPKHYITWSYRKNTLILLHYYIYGTWVWLEKNERKKGVGHNVGDTYIVATCQNRKRDYLKGHCGNFMSMDKIS